MSFDDITPVPGIIRPMLDTDWQRVAEIYTQGILEGNSTFNRVCPAYEKWDAGHLNICRYVHETDGVVDGWIAVSHTSGMPAYSGSVEVSLYIDKARRGCGIGPALMRHLIDEAPGNGIWSLLSVICSVNTHSIHMHEKCGFRVIGTRERIAKDRFDVWQDTTLMELRLKY